MVPYGDRGGVPIEPLLTEQWYADAATLAKPAIEAVETGRTRFVPEAATKTYYDWMRNIQPWCISRQLWWGHRDRKSVVQGKRVSVRVDLGGRRILKKKKKKKTAAKQKSKK